MIQLDLYDFKIFLTILGDSTRSQVIPLKSIRYITVIASISLHLELISRLRKCARREKNGLIFLFINRAILLTLPHLLTSFHFNAFMQNLIYWLFRGNFLSSDFMKL